MLQVSTLTYVIIEMCIRDRSRGESQQRVKYTRGGNNRERKGEDQLTKSIKNKVICRVIRINLCITICHHEG